MATVRISARGARPTASASCPSRTIAIRRALNVSPTYTRFIEGLPLGESKAILDYLYLHMQRPEHAYRHRWAHGDLLIWDNRSVMHHAAADYTDRRVMHRISVIGPA